MNLKKIAVIVAGGSGLRMNSPVPKQFMLLKNKPILMHTLEKFYRYDNKIELRLALPSSEFDYWKKLCAEYNFNIKHLLFEGGKHRFDSVKNSLKDILSPSLVAIHDGVRPLVSLKTITNCFDLAEKKGAAIPVLKLTESIRKITGEGSVSMERNLFRSVQTPQVFQSEIILNAYNTPYKESFTDDASVVENYGKEIFLAEGNEENIKITSPNDLLIAEVLFGLHL
jgi:2-C-methyl-D-erythritol 4-phosphate cytidylyltransferase